jgi:hypothetical protein
MKLPKTKRLNCGNRVCLAHVQLRRYYTHMVSCLVFVQASIEFVNISVKADHIIFYESFSKTLHGGLKDLTKMPL